MGRSYMGFPVLGLTLALQFSERKLCRSVSCSSKSWEELPVSATSFQMRLWAAVELLGESQGASE